jgi:molybdopterin converting factor subunit 1
MTVHVKFFAILRERIGSAGCVWQLDPGRTVGDLWVELCAAFPPLGAAGTSVAFAVNREYVDRFHCLHDNDEVAIIPPVSGGSPIADPGWRAVPPQCTTSRRIRLT